MRWNQIATLHSGDDSEIGKGKQKAHLIVATDACLPLLNSRESPIAALVLIKYEISTKTVGLSLQGLCAPQQYNTINLFVLLLLYLLFFVHCKVI